jgi:hypothetical protein
MRIIKSNSEREVEVKEIISKLAKAGIKVQSGKKGPKDGRFSGVIGDRQEELKLNI